MDNPSFNIQEHIIPCQHIREYPQALKSQRQLRLAVKQYTPLTLAEDSNAVTIIGAHGNGIPKVGCTYITISVIH
jgi:hypothetical protein